MEFQPQIVLFRQTLSDEHFWSEKKFSNSPKLRGAICYCNDATEWANVARISRQSDCTKQLVSHCNKHTTKRTMGSSRLQKTTQRDSRATPDWMANMLNMWHYALSLISTTTQWWLVRYHNTLPTFSSQDQNVKLIWILVPLIWSTNLWGTTHKVGITGHPRRRL